MAYNTIKSCARCGNSFKVKSNPQIYCSTCKPIVRKEKNKVWQNDYYMKNQVSKLEKTKAYNKSEKGRAAQKLRDAVRQGKIERKPCEVCGAPKAQGHHEDYSKPLDVRWLCAQHHREEHLFEPWQNELRRAGYTDGFLLGQLIEACGDRFGGISRNPVIIAGAPREGEWTAYSYVSPCDGINMPIGEGSSTPEEAVAQLWLALNKKRTND